MGCQALLQGIFPIRGSNLHLLSLLHLQAGSLPLAPPGTPPNKHQYMQIMNIQVYAFLYPGTHCLQVEKWNLTFTSESPWLLPSQGKHCRHSNTKPLLCCAQSLSRVRPSATPWTVARQALLSMGSLQARILEWFAVPSSMRSS